MTIHRSSQPPTTKRGKRKSAYYTPFLYIRRPMRQLLTTLQRTWRRWQRMQHRCGYGIHSPFAFQLVTGVIYEKEAYYAFAPLHELRSECLSHLDERDDRLLFRLINHHQPASCMLIGAQTSLTLQYLKAGCRQCHFWHIEQFATSPTHPLTQHIAEAEMLCLIGCEDRWEWAERALQAEHPRCMMVISDIDAEGGNRWRQLIKDKRVRVSFDLGHIGIVCCEKRLNKQDYIISY